MFTNHQRRTCALRNVSRTIICCACAYLRVGGQEYRNMVLCIAEASRSCWNSNSGREGIALVTLLDKKNLSDMAVGNSQQEEEPVNIPNCENCTNVDTAIPTCLFRSTHRLLHRSFYIFTVRQVCLSRGELTEAARWR